MTARRIDFFIRNSDRLRSLADGARQSAELQHILLNTVPPGLARACHVQHLRSGTLTLLAENAAVAAKLKQLIPRLLITYRKRGSQVTSIRVDVQAWRTLTVPDVRIKKQQLPIESIRHFENLADRLQDSPLKEAVLRLAAHQREKA